MPTCVLCLGTELGAETTGQYALRPRGRVIQLDAAPERIGAHVSGARRWSVTPS